MDIREPHYGRLLGGLATVCRVEPGGHPRMRQSGVRDSGGSRSPAVRHGGQIGFERETGASMELLGRNVTLWPVDFKGQPGVEPLTEKEQTALIDRLAPLLKEPDPATRTAAIYALGAASAPRSDELKSLRTRASCRRWRPPMRRSRLGRSATLSPRSSARSAARRPGRSGRAMPTAVSRSSKTPAAGRAPTLSAGCRGRRWKRRVTTSASWFLNGLMRRSGSSKRRK